MRDALTRGALALALFLAILAAPAFAADTRVDAAPIIAAWRPLITEIVAGLVAALAGYLAMLLRTRLGLDIDARHREAFQVALTNAAGLVLDRIARSASGASVDVKSAAVAESVEYVLSRVPDAIKHFKVTPESVRLGIEAKLGAAK